MRQITKDIQIIMDGSPVGFRITKLDAFSGVILLRLLMRLGNSPWCHSERNEVESKNLPAAATPFPRSAPTLLDLIASLSEDELRSVMTSVFNHAEVLLPAGPIRS